MLPTDPRHTGGTIVGTSFEDPSLGARSAFHASVKAVACARGRSTVLPTDPRHTGGTIAGAFRGPVPWPKEAALTDFTAPSEAAGNAARYRRERATLNAALAAAYGRKLKANQASWGRSTPRTGRAAEPAGANGGGRGRSPASRIRETLRARSLYVHLLRLITRDSRRPEVYSGTCARAAWPQCTSVCAASCRKAVRFASNLETEFICLNRQQQREVHSAHFVLSTFSSKFRSS